jgi:hypothetical protein
LGNQFGYTIATLALAARALDAQHIELALDVAEDEIASGHWDQSSSGSHPVNQPSAKHIAIVPSANANITSMSASM